MENNEEVVEKGQEYQSPFSDVAFVDPDKPAEVGQEAAAEGTQTVDPESLAKELEEWKQKVTDLESREPVKEVVYQLPEDYVSIMENPENRRLLDTDPASLSDVDLFKETLQAEKPWLNSESLLRKEIIKQFPDADFDIPENLGLPEDEWGEIKFKADGRRAEISQQKSDLEAKIEAAKQSALQSKGQEQSAPDVEAQIAFLTEELNAGLAGKVVPQVDIPLEGFQLPVVSDAEVTEMFNNGNAIFKVDGEKGFVPDVQAMHDALLLKKTLEALKPMVEAAKRVAPKEAREALEASLANKTLHNKDNGGVRSEDPNAKQVYVSPFSDVRMVQ
jgi:hypothetical protein